MFYYALIIGDGACVGFEESIFAGNKSYWCSEDGDDWLIVRFEMDKAPELPGDVYADTAYLLKQCLSWEVTRCGDKPYASPFMEYIGGAWCLLNQAGSVVDTVWVPGEEEDEENDD